MLCLTLALIAGTIAPASATGAPATPSPAAAAVAAQPAVPQLAPAQPTKNESGGTPITTQQSNEYYLSCITNPGAMPRFNPLQKEYLCSCAAVGIQANLTAEELASIRDTKTPAGRAAMTTMLETAYFPCALPMMEENLSDECRRRSRGSSFGVTGMRYCGCVVNRVMSYVRTVGISDTIYNLSFNGGVSEPVDALINGSGYNHEMIRSYEACFGGNIP
jgi:hypothetical protein